MPLSWKQITAQLDALYEFDREPVREDKLQKGWEFAGLFAGEHIAGTEFVIGAMFVLHGVSARDVLLGLLLGNVLAVLSWTFICAPIAVRTRLTLYWYLRKIGGPGLTAIYNIANALLYCILAGAMISVSATAIGLAFDVPTPELSAKLPTSLGWVVITLVAGGVVTTVAILGFEKLAKFSSVCSPWMVLIFLAGALAVFPELGTYHSLADLRQIAESKIWTGTLPAEAAAKGLDKLGFWHMVFFAWFCNLAMNVDLSDMAIFRYARNHWYGLYTAFGIFPGHYMAWLASGVMVAAVGLKMSPGQMAMNAAGLAGAIAVLIAGWTTANPTMYRAGLAFQSITPNWPRWKVTLAAGIATTLFSCFPFFFMRLLDFVAIYGLLLMPIGAVVFAEHWLFPRLNLEQYRVERLKQLFNWPALLTWALTLAACYFMPFHLFFRWLPGYFIALILYLALSFAWQKAGTRTAAVNAGATK
jgi:purine-cytosine permease-like protein